MFVAFSLFAGLELHFAKNCEAGGAKLANCLAEVGNLPDLLVWNCILLKFARLAEQNSQIVSQKWAICPICWSGIAFY